MLINNKYKPQMLPKQQKNKSPFSANWRNDMLIVSIALMFAIVLAQAFYLGTVEQQKKLRQESNKRFVADISMPVSRGMITDRNGNVLALSIPAKSVYVNGMPGSETLKKLSELIKMPFNDVQETLRATGNLQLGRLDKETSIKIKNLDLQGFTLEEHNQLFSIRRIPMPTAKQIQQLSELIDVPAATLKQRLESTKTFTYLKRQLSEETAQKIKALNIHGLKFQSELKRHYPSEHLFAHVIGFTSIDGNGQSGLELKHNKNLSSKNGRKSVLQDRKGNIVRELDSTKNRNPKQGLDIVSSLDLHIQRLADKELRNAINLHHAKAGSVVVLDAQTGEVLALANYPTYNPNRNDSKNSASNAAGQNRLLNRAVVKMVEPGSVIKPFVVAKALDAKKVGTHTLLGTQPLKIGSQTVRDYYNMPPLLDVRGVIQKSSNVGSSKLSALFSAEEMHAFYQSLGIGQRTDSGYPGETSGRLRRWENWKPFEQATMSYGYGLQMSLLQLARAYTAITSNGRLLPVSFEKQETPPQGEQVITAETARTMRNIMVAVTEKGGTGTKGAISGFKVGAKTGTARKIIDTDTVCAQTDIACKQKSKRYADNQHISTFVGFAPAEKPRLIVAVLIDEPSNGHYLAGEVAAPAFKNIMSGSLNILGILPAELQHNTAVQTAVQ